MALIRPMVPGDYPVVAQISNDAAIQGLVGLPTWETAAEVAHALAGLRQSEFVVAEDDQGQIVGYAGYHLTEAGDAMLYGPLVIDGGRGIGAYLASRIESMARHRGAVTFTMLIGIQNRQGAAWAEWRGYQLDSEFPETLLAWIYPGELKPGRPLDEGSIRRAAPDDLDRVAELYQACFQADTARRTDWNDWVACTWLFEVSGAVRGLVHLDHATATILHLAVAPGFRRHGIGAALLEAAIADFWRERPAKVGIALPLDNANGVALIRRLGFRREIGVARWLKRDG